MIPISYINPGPEAARTVDTVDILEKGTQPLIRSRPLRLSSLLLLVVFIFACSSNGQQSLGPQSMQGAMEADPIVDYHLRPGDAIEVKFFYHPELNESMRVGPDGKITLQLIDDVLVAGLTASQLDELLTQEYASHLQNYEITVFVRDYSALKVYVGGEVRNRGFLSIGDGNISILQAIMARGGFTSYAHEENIILVRKGLDNRPVATVVDLEPVLEGEELENDIYLMPSDIVYVPQTWIGKAGDFVDQYMRRVFFVDTVLEGIGYALGYKWVYDDWD